MQYNHRCNKNLLGSLVKSYHLSQTTRILSIMDSKIGSLTTGNVNLNLKALIEF